jgi:hypothetical protein
MEAVYEVVAAYCKAHDINYSYCKEFFQRLQNEAFRVKDELLTEVPAAAQRLWASPLPLSSMIGHEKELCNIINEAIRADAPGGMRHLATLVRGINTLCVIRRPSGAVNFPSNGICWRGGGLPAEHQTFYVPGKVYRVPGFLATSFSEDKAEEFLYRAHVLAGHPAIKWVVHLDARGATQHKYRCRHVDLVRHSNTPGEEEFLFAPYSVFTVKEAQWSPHATDDTPHVVHLEAAIDNNKESMELPLAPWY